MVRPDEERRALLSRQQTRRQEAARRVRSAALRGNNATAQAIRADWAPVLLARLEADHDEREDDDE